ncbi:hypothetical protein [uncultured Winogradskyella sp.]|uniref:hypothetical protein n=1 Tax=uncultured Winogradskyella sp. TaxID=395353 RepID=UPI0035195714
MTTITRLLIPLALTFMFTVVNGQTKEVDSVKTDTSEVVKQRNAYKEEQIERLKAQKKQVEEQEREYLKQDIERINKRLDAGVISAAEAEKLKGAAAQLRAENIADKLLIIDKQIALWQRTDKPYQVDMPDLDDGGTYIRIGGDEETSEAFIYIGERKYDKPKKYDRRTTEDVVFAFGYNNAIIDGQSLGDSPYESSVFGFVELGYAWKTRIFNNTNFWRVKYGFSFQWNKLRMEDNNYLVNNNDNIELQQFPIDVDKVKFRTTNLVVPVHLEFGPSKKIERDTYYRYSTRNQLKFGVGGYAGLNIGSMQKLKYEVDNNRIEEKQRGGFEVSPFVYGLSGYVAWGGIGIYAKYDLNPIFKNQAVDQNNFSVGLRFDMD